jgi:hypothetical protein
MIESVAPRDGIAKYAGDYKIDPVNGGDRDLLEGDDLQYACIEERAEKGKGNDCDGASPDKKNPLCAADGTQPRFKAYPGLRHLRIVKDLGASGFVASICNTSYAPAIQGITEKLKAALNAQCLRSSLAQDPSGEVKCLLFESMKEAATVAKCEDVKGLCTPGSEPCRKAGTDYPPITPEAAAAQLNLPITVVSADGVAKSTPTQASVEGGNVYVTGTDGRKHIVCEIAQLDGAELSACTTKADYKPAAGGGWCYSTQGDIVGDQCKKVGAPGTIRFFGGAEPRNGSEVFTYCFGGS